jgi:hypothetical protein
VDSACGMAPKLLKFSGFGDGGSCVRWGGQLELMSAFPTSNEGRMLWKKCPLGAILMPGPEAPMRAEEGAPSLYSSE